MSFMQKVARDVLAEAKPVLVSEFLHAPNRFLPRHRSWRESRFQPAAKSLNTDLDHVVRAVDKAGLNCLVDYACVLGLELDGHVRLLVIRVTLRRLQWIVTLGNGSLPCRANSLCCKQPKT